MQVIRVSVIAALVIIIVAFQNCARSDFSLIGGIAENNLVALEQGEDGSIETLTVLGAEPVDVPKGNVKEPEATSQESEPEESAAVVAPVEVVAVGSPEEDGKDGKDGEDGKDGKDGKDGEDGEDGEDGKDGGEGSVEVEAPAAEDTSSGSDDVGVCILEGNGKSLKLGLAGSHLAGVKAMASAVCVSQKACLELVPQKFNVQASYDRGACGGNPNVVILTDAQVQALLDK